MKSSGRLRIVSVHPGLVLLVSWFDVSSDQRYCVSKNKQGKHCYPGIDAANRLLVDTNKPLKYAVNSSQSKDSHMHEMNGQ